MKLPFKIPGFKLPKFGKKKTDDDEDDNDDDFDPADFEDDNNVSPDQAPVPPAAEGGAGEEAAPAAEGEEGGAGAEAGDAPDTGEDLEDIDFGDDDDEDEEGGGKSKRKMLVIGGGAAAAVLLIGGLSWFLLSGDGEKEKTARKDTGIPVVTIDIAPKKRAMGGVSLNAIAAGAAGPGAGVMVAVVSPMAFASLAPPSVTDAPLLDNDPDLSEISPQGPLPVISEDGRMAWRVYAKPFKNQDARPRVAIVISGLGLSEAATEAAIRLLPGNVTLAFDPYAPGLFDWVARARQAGHEVLIMVPLEPSTFPIEDPGPQGLMTTNAPEENRLRLEYILSRMTGYIGVMTVMGSKFNTSDEYLRTFLGEIKTRGLMFLEGGVDANSLAPKIATEIGLPRALADIIVDSIPTRGAIDDQLAELESILDKKPVAVAVAEAYPSSIERLAAWTAALETKNLVLAPLSAVADKQFLE